MSHVELTGKVFGELTVLRRLSTTRGGSVLWECKCSCGNTYEASSRHLNRKENNVRSCGCKQHLRGRDHSQWGGAGDISGGWWGTHVLRAAKPSTTRLPVQVTLTIEDAWRLFLKQGRKCALTGLDIWFEKKSNSSARRVGGTASLDRIDNRIGYVEGNVQWVHKRINMMRGSMDIEEFVRLAELVTKHKRKQHGLST